MNESARKEWCRQNGVEYPYPQHQQQQQPQYQPQQQQPYLPAQPPTYSQNCVEGKPEPPPSDQEVTGHGCTE